MRPSEYNCVYIYVHVYIYHDICIRTYICTYIYIYIDSLGSWALTLKGVAAAVGATSWEGFRCKCGPVAESLGRAESKLVQNAS